MKHLSRPAHRRTVPRVSSEWAEVSLLKARAQGAEGPVVPVLDLRDDHTRAFNESVAGSRKVEDVLEEVECRRSSLFVTWSLP